MFEIVNYLKLFYFLGYLSYTKNMDKMLTLEDLQKDDEINTLITLAERQLEALGFTEHSYRHLGIVSKRAENILSAINATPREIRLGQIAGYLHDIGNSVNRHDHAHTGALLVYSLLLQRGMNYVDASEVMIAVGNHDENNGIAVSKISAALIIADKSDVHRSRVRQNKLNQNNSLASQDIHDRVNFAVEDSKLLMNMEKQEISFQFTIDTSICSAMDYFEIFTRRMKMCRAAAKYLDMGFKLKINHYDLV